MRDAAETIADVETAKPRSKKKWLALLIPLIALLVVTNPSPSDYKKYVEENITSKIVDKVPSGAAGMSVSPVWVEINNIIGRSSRRDNYGLFSVYVSRLYNQNVGFLGVLGKFIPLH